MTDTRVSTIPLSEYKKPQVDTMQRVEAERLQHYEEQESKRAKLYMPDIQINVIISLVLATIGLLTSFVVSYSVLVDVSGWMKLPWDFLNYFVPGFVEFLILFSTLDYIISRSRGKKAWAPFWFMFFVSTIAVVGQGVHAYNGWLETGSIPWYGWFGVFMGSLVPLVVVYVTKRMTVLIFSEPIKVGSSAD